MELNGLSSSEEKKRGGKAILARDWSLCRNWFSGGSLWVLEQLALRKLEDSLSASGDSDVTGVSCPLGNCSLLPTFHFLDACPFGVNTNPWELRISRHRVWIIGFLEDITFMSFCHRCTSWGVFCLKKKFFFWKKVRTKMLCFLK